MPTETLKEVTVYTDGACQGNPGRGGFCAVLQFGDKRREIVKGYRLTTNNRMEMRAAIAGLEALRYPCRVTIWTDSKYLADGIEQGWAKRWRSKGWVVKSGERAANVDLWAQLLALCETHEVRFRWLKGHAGHEENELCDRLSVEAAAGEHLEVDEAYEALAKQ
ncbi:MAG: ribonuclease HI [Armatimonadetes bacterium]|nr:ribonuclease HI [Armatimonadota bacterium]